MGRAIHDKGVTPDIVIDEGIIESFQDKEEEELVQPDKIFEQIEKKINQLTSGIIFDYKSDPQIMGGIDALKEIRKIDPRVGVIMVTAISDEELGKRAIALGACDYITKPLNFDYLETALMVKMIDLLG